MTSLQQAIQFIEKSETPWSRDNSAPWGIHDADPPPPTTACMVRYMAADRSLGYFSTRTIYLHSGANLTRPTSPLALPKPIWRYWQAWPLIKASFTVFTPRSPNNVLALGLRESACHALHGTTFYNKPASGKAHALAFQNRLTDTDG